MFKRHLLHFDMSIKKNTVQTKLNELLKLFRANDILINSHVADFFTKDLWHSVIPLPIIQEIENLDITEFIRVYHSCIIKNDFSSLPPHLFSFLKDSFQESKLEDSNYVTRLLDLSNRPSWPSEPKLSAYMSHKKKHEVIRMVPLVGALAQATATSSVIDIGGGKGYLGSVLAKHCQLQILSLDSSLSTTHGAAILESKLAKACKEESNSFGHCHRETVVISRSTKLHKIIQRNFKDKADSVGLIGLHTCGDLATTSMHLFLRKEVVWIVNVGCCYHLLYEEFESDPFWDDLQLPEHGCGFPVSSFLRNKEVKLGRNARMLAAHSLDRMAVEGVSKESSQSLFYRALLQILVKEHGREDSKYQVGRLARKCSTFSQYIRKAIQKLHLNLDLPEEDIQRLLMENSASESKLEVFFLLRTHFAPVVESIILLDRLLFLLEQNVDAYLVPLFDPVVSPRRFAIVAMKNGSQL